MSQNSMELLRATGKIVTPEKTFKRFLADIFKVISINENIPVPHLTIVEMSFRIYISIATRIGVNPSKYIANRLNRARIIIIYRLRFYPA